MKQIKIFERKVPMLAVIMAVLIIGIASAAVFTNYATLSGDVIVESPVSVIGTDNIPILIGDNGVLTFNENQEATFSIENSGSESVIVELGETISFLEEGAGTGAVPAILTSTDELEGLSIVYSGSGVTGNSVEIAGTTTTTITVDFITVHNALEGTYTIEIAVNVPDLT